MSVSELEHDDACWCLDLLLIIVIRSGYMWMLSLTDSINHIFYLFNNWKYKDNFTSTYLEETKSSGSHLWAVGDWLWCARKRGGERGRVVPPLVSARQTPLLSLCGRTAFIERPQRGMFSNCPLETRITTDSERASTQKFNLVVSLLHFLLTLSPLYLSLFSRKEIFLVKKILWETTYSQ